MGPEGLDPFDRSNGPFADSHISPDESPRSLRRRAPRRPHEGSFVLDISGLPEGRDPQNRIVFARPVGALVVRHVLALVGLGFLLLASLIGSILLFPSHR